MEGEFKVRLAEPSDAASLVRLIERCYQGTYVDADALDPTVVAERIRAGRVMFAITESLAGEALGAGALDVVNPWTAVFGRCVVAAEHRGRGMLTAIGRLLVHRVGPERGLRYIHSSAVANHAFAQRHGVTLGGTASGLLLGRYPDETRMRGIEAAPQPVSAAQLVFGHDPDPECRSLGLRGADLLRARRVLDAFEIPSQKLLRGRAQCAGWRLEEHPAEGLAHFVPAHGGQELDFSACFDARLVWVDVSPTATDAQERLDDLRATGFCFGAYLLGMGPAGQDVVRMQRYQGATPIHEDALVLVDEFGETFRDVLADYRRSQVAVL